MRRLLALVILVSTLVVVSSEPASACTCYPGYDTAEALEAVDGAFIGRLVSRREHSPEFVYRFEVDRVVKGTFGSLVDLQSSGGGGDCGIETPIGEPIGLLVYQRDGVLRSDLCSQVEPDRMARAAEPVPPPDGVLPVRLLVGTSYGPGRVLALDAQGRVVAFGAGAGLTTVISVCPGGKRMVEVSVPAEPPIVPVLTVRQVETMAIEAEMALHGFGPENGVYREVETVACRDGAGSDLVLFVREESPDYQSRIVRLRGTEQVVLWKDAATHGVFDASGRGALVAGGRTGTELMAVDLVEQPGTARPVTALPCPPGRLSLSATGALAATCTPAIYGSPLLVLAFQPSTGSVRTASIHGEHVSG
ncbi:MAG: hypothetical protein ACRDYV_12215, partial [Acidimicrobiia bacterium]